MSGTGRSISAPVRPTPGLTAMRFWRALGRPFLAGGRLWRRSLQMRTVVISVVLSAAALAGVGSYMSLAIERGLFDDRLQQVLDESDRSTAAAQAVFDASTSDDPTSLGALRLTAIDQLGTGPTGPVGSAMETPTDADSSVLPNIRTGEASDSVISAALRRSVASGSANLHWQSVALPNSGGAPHPGIVVGSTIHISSAHDQQLFLVYDLNDVQTTLDFVHRTMLIGGTALLVLIAAVTMLVVRLVVLPIRQAAAVSEELAAGRLERRIPEHGADEVATLARSFNRMADGLQRQITQLANLSTVQQRFVSDVSHELRTPLTTIRLATDVLYDARGDFAPAFARSAELLHTQVQRFEALLADLLEISRMDAQAATVSDEPMNLVVVAREAIDAYHNLAEETRTEVRLETPGGYVEIEADERRIARVVRNLLANALEHGESRPVVVTVDSSATAVAIGVRDHGVGMDIDATAHVFERFWRADPSRQRRIGGTGLGLAISREDAALHGGTLQVWSEPGAGANFVLTLPRTPGVPPGPSPVPLLPADAAAPLVTTSIPLRNWFRRSRS